MTATPYTPSELAALRERDPRLAATLDARLDEIRRLDIVLGKSVRKIADLEGLLAGSNSMRVGYLAALKGATHALIEAGDAKVPDSFMDDYYEPIRLLVRQRDEARAECDWYRRERDEARRGAPFHDTLALQRDAACKERDLFRQAFERVALFVQGLADDLLRDTRPERDERPSPVNPSDGGHGVVREAPTGSKGPHETPAAGSPIDVAAERIAFIAWARGRWGVVLVGDTFDAVSEHAWQAWLARAERGAK